MVVNLITGGSGFLGSSIAGKLCERGQQVKIFDLFDSPDRPQNAQFIQGDVRDPASLDKACSGVDVIYHNAALVPLTKAGRAFREVNVDGTKNVLDAAVNNGVRKIVHASSSAIYGVPDACPIDETTLPSPIEPYGLSKLEGEKIMSGHGGGPNLSVSIIRPRTIVGTGRLGIFQILFSWIKAGKNIYTIGPGSNLFQFIHLDDLVDSMIFAAKRDENESYNIGAAEFSTLHEDLSALCSHASTGSSVRHLPQWLSITALRILDSLRLSPLAPWHYLTYHKPFYFDISKAATRLGWKPRYSNAQMLIQAYDLFREGASATLEKASAHRKSPAQKILGLLRRFS